MSSQQGWISLHRTLLDWEWYTDSNTKILFIHLLLRANHKDSKWRGIEVKRGQVLTGRTKLAKETGLSEQQIRTSFKKLKSTGEITTKATSKLTIVTLLNWGAYQEKEKGSNQQINRKATNEQPASNQQVTTNNNDNKENNVNNDNKKDIVPDCKMLKDEVFEKLWSFYGYKKNKSGSKKAFMKLNEKDIAEIRKQLPLYLKNSFTDGVSTPSRMHLSTYINGRRWEDEIIAPVSKGAQVTTKSTLNFDFMNKGK
jgi:hypothetical protein